MAAGDEVNPVLAELAHEPGVLTWRGGRYLLIRPETLAALQRAVEAAVGDRAGDCFAAGGRAGGGRAVSQLEGDPAERITRLLTMGSAIGWGEFHLDAMTSAQLVVTVRRSPFAEAYGRATAPVCHLTRGVLESLTASAFGSAWRVSETACAATGAPACRFEAAPPP